MKKRVFLLCVCLFLITVSICFLTACKNGITPQLKIGDDNYWYVSYDEGKTWVSLNVKATGEKDENAGTDGLAYYPLPDGSYAVSVGTAKYLDVIIIPEKYNGKAVTQILPAAFSSAVNLTAISIPSSVTSIGYSAFSDCTGLTSVTIGNGVTSIGNYAFYECTGLTSIKYHGTEAQWSSISKGHNWDCYYDNGNYKKLNYTITYNYTGE